MIANSLFLQSHVPTRLTSPMSKAIPSLFADSVSESPFVYNADSVPRRESKPALTFRFDKGELGLSKGLITLLRIEEVRQVMFVNYKGSAYVARVDKGGYWIELRTREGSGICSGTINAKRFVQDAVRVMGHGPGEVLSFPVASFPVMAEEIGLDRVTYPYPFYRVNRDQKTMKA